MNQNAHRLPSSRNFLSLDLEMNQPSGLIIQIGVCIGNLQTSEVLYRNDWIVNPGEPLDPRIVALTGISEETIATRGVPMAQAYDELKKANRSFDCYVNPIVWGGGDSVELRSQCDGKDWPFGHRFFDMKTLWQWKCMQEGRPTQGGLAKSMTKMGLNFQGRKHDANDDAFNTFRVACFLMNGVKI